MPANDYGDDDDYYEEPPLYREGRLQSMTVEELEKEHDHQCDVQGAIGDQEPMWSTESRLADAEARIRMVNAELARRREGFKIFR